MAASIGIAFTPFEDRVEVIEQTAVRAEQRGFASIGVAEAMTLAAPIVLARLADRTERIKLVTGVLSVWGRTPATLALTAAELQRVSGVARDHVHVEVKDRLKRDGAAGVQQVHAVGA